MQQKLIIYAVCFIVLVEKIAFSTTITLMPEIIMNAKEGILQSNSSISMRSFCYSAAYVTLLISSLFGAQIFGGLADRYGVKKIFLVAGGLFNATTLCSLIAIKLQSLIFFFTFLVLLGLIDNLSNLAMLIIDKNSNSPVERTRNFSLLSMIMLSGWLISPAIMILLQYSTHGGVITPFAISAILSLISVGAILYILRHMDNDLGNTQYAIKQPPNYLNIFHGIWLILSSYDKLKISVSYFLFILSSTIFWQSISLYMVSTYHYGILHLSYFLFYLNLVRIASVKFLPLFFGKYMLDKAQLLIFMVILSLLLFIEFIEWDFNLIAHLFNNPLNRTWFACTLIFMFMPNVQNSFRMMLASISHQAFNQGAIISGYSQVSVLAQALAAMSVGFLIKHHFVLEMCALSMVVSTTLLLFSFYPLANKSNA
jgi:MFS family permease